MNKSFDEWMEAYGRDHQNPTNKLIHKFCVPLILFSVLGLLWSVKLPIVESSFSNLSMLVAIGGLLFYLKLSQLYFVMMLVKVSLMIYLITLISHEAWFLNMCIGIFVAAWIGQFIGHKIEGQKPSFLEDIVFIMIGPLWVCKSLYEEK